jgi:hypothetical protein
VSELASVMGGVSTKTLPNNLPTDTWKQGTTIKADGQSERGDDLVLSHLDCDGIAHSGYDINVVGLPTGGSEVYGSSSPSYGESSVFSSNGPQFG